MSNQPVTKRIRLETDRTCAWKCTFCLKMFSTNKQFNNHKNKTGHMVNDTSVEAHAEEDTLENESSDEFVRNYQGGCTFDSNNAQVYEMKSVDNDTFTYSEMMSIELYDLVTSFKAPQEMHRRLVHLANTLIRDHNKIEPEGKILHHDVVDRMLKQRSNLRSQTYDMCKNGCKLFSINEVNDPNESCNYCNEKRYEVVKDVTKPASTLKMMSCGDQIAVRLGDDNVRKQLQYPTNRTNTVNGMMTDIHDGSVLTNYNRILDKRSNTIEAFIMLFVDGFVNQKKGKRNLTLFHVNILNFDPSNRSEDNSMIQLAILPGPKKPEDLDSFLSPFVNEIQNLSTNGMVIKRGNIEVCRARVHLVAATGDIVGVSNLIHHAGHNSNYPCRYRLGRSETLDNESRGKYLLDTSAPLRKIRDFVDGDMEHGIKDPTIFSELPSFNGAIFTCLDELHLIGGVAKLVFEIVVFEVDIHKE